jgi:hypothetical protein
MSATEPELTPPRAFISYSWDDDSHQEWVKQLAIRLRADGVDVTLDRWHVAPGDQLPAFMERAVRNNDFVIAVCTRAFKRKSDERGGGVGYEGDIMTAYSLTGGGQKKFIPVLRQGSWMEAAPTWLLGRIRIDLSDDPYSEPQYEELLRTLYDAREKAPPIGHRPNFSDKVKIASSRITRHSPRTLFGRDPWLDALDAAWADSKRNVYALVAWGGVGKTSLVAHWITTRMEKRGWLGVERYFDWSFYSQGTGESRQTSSNPFIDAALQFFDDPDPTAGDPWERGQRLALLVRRHRTLLVLDGVEPLQYPANDPQAGRLKDLALESLLNGLAADNPGLCIVTTREHLKNLEARAMFEERKLDKLPKEAAIALLRHLGIIGTEAEMEAAWREAGGHALTLHLLGRFIADAYPADPHVSRYKEVKFKEADQERQGRSAFKMMAAYERWLASAGPYRQRELAFLRLTGLFDRPIPHDCLETLRAKPAIRGLTSDLVKLKDTEWNVALSRLRDIDLVTVTPEGVDVHPLIREYFAVQLRKGRPAAFRAAHSRLFDHLCKTTDPRPGTHNGLQPLYQAVVHGCLAGRHKEACDNVFIDRISRGTDGGGNYSTKKFGAIGDDLAALASFFDEPWSRVSPNLDEGSQAWRLAQAGSMLHALGRLTEALQPTLTALEMRVQQQAWQDVVIIAVNLSELEVTMGRLADAADHARQSNSHAEQIGEAYWQMVTRSTLANALYLSGQWVDAGKLFAKGEQMMKELPPALELLVLRWGFHYCDWQLTSVERAAWQSVLRSLDSKPGAWEESAAICNEVELRAEATLSWVTSMNWLLDIALDQLTLARVGLFRAILANALPQPALFLPRVAEAVSGLHAARQVYELPKGLLTAALYFLVRGEPEAARASLNEAQQIAERGPMMPLYLADVHLYRARLFRDRAELAKARALVEEHGYWRRKEELEDAEAVACNWPT